jgi:hypothetical protein
MDTTYEENAHRIFPINERLCQGIIVLEKAFADANEPAPLWAPEVPRNHPTFGEGFVPAPQNILEANKLANQMITGSEELNQKLTINEVQRLYNRALQLAVRMRDLSPKERTTFERRIGRPKPPHSETSYSSPTKSSKTCLSKSSTIAVL